MAGVWPEGVNCAVTLSFDVDAELLWKVWKPDPTEMDLSQGRYGPRVGLPRLLDMLDRQGVKATFFTPGWVAEQYSEILKETADRGHEIAHHGYLHEDNSKLGLEEEREMLVRGSEALKRVTGQTPVGLRLWRSPNTIRLLEELGFIYDSSMMDSDLPYRVRDAGRKTSLIELPVYFSFNDTLYFVFAFGMNKPVLTPDQVFSIYCQEFDALYDERSYCMFMLHPQVIGRPSRTRMLERTIEYMRKRRGVWFATAKETAEHCRKVLD